MTACKFQFCLHQQDEACTLDEFAVDSSGMCANLNAIYLDADFLKQEKQWQLGKANGQGSAS